MEGITKRFGRLIADDAVTFDVRAGEIHALLGENGAGKSTLMKILYGLHQPDDGRILIDGIPVEIGSPHQAVSLGIGMVHQNFMLVPTLTAVENAVLGMPADRPPLLDIRGARKRLVELAREYQLAIDPDVPVWQMSVGAQQRLEILKALYRGARLLVLDEPTAVLAPQEAGQLFRIMRHLASEGRGIIFISHKLTEVKDVSDRVTVLRHGLVTGSLPTADASASELATMMVGREVKLGRTAPPGAGTSAVLTVEAVSCQTDRDTPGLRSVSLTVRAGEIVGIAGVDGNGQSELVECVAGLRPLSDGRITINGEPVRGALRDPGLLGLIPEDRYRQGLVADFSVAENLVLKAYARPPFTERGFLRWSRINSHAREQIEAFDIRTSGPVASVKSLSGGNQQKVIVARETQEQPALLVASQPTRGLDVGAVENVLGLIRRQRDRGAAVLLVSTELSELFALSDRIAVMHQGEIMGEVTPDPALLGQVGEMMMGRSLVSTATGAGSAA
jgi:simple sugar transport system ATP-binding protein